MQSTIGQNTVRKNIKVALTGGIGTGKTTVAKMLRLLKIPVFDADKEAHCLLQNDSKVIHFVSQECPRAIIENSVDRLCLSGYIQQNPNLLKKLESILHPLIDGKRNEFCEIYKTEPLLIFEIPLLFEAGLQKNYDFVVVTICAVETQEQRVLSRTGMTLEKYKFFSDRQLSLEEKKKKADFVIQTDYSRVKTFRQLRRIFMNKCKREL